VGAAQHVIAIAGEQHALHGRSGRVRGGAPGGELERQVALAGDGARERGSAIPDLRRARAATHANQHPDGIARQHQRLADLAPEARGHQPFPTDAGAR
jgi:hypothetical protein